MSHRFSVMAHRNWKCPIDFDKQGAIGPYLQLSFPTTGGLDEAIDIFEGKLGYLSHGWVIRHTWVGWFVTWVGDSSHMGWVIHNMGGWWVIWGGWWVHMGWVMYVVYVQCWRKGFEPRQTFSDKMSDVKQFQVRHFCLQVRHLWFTSDIRTCLTSFASTAVGLVAGHRGWVMCHMGGSLVTLIRW